MSEPKKAAQLEELPDMLGVPHSKMALRLWLRLLTTTTEIEKIIRTRLSEQFSTTLPRFDILSALDRHPEGLRMGDLSKLLMVSAGNVTAIVERLQKDGLLVREVLPNDRRTFIVRMTDKGAREFATMAKTHEDWLDTIFEELDNQSMESLLELLNRARHSVRAADRDKS